HASVVVSDTGPGIEPQERSTIFDEFIQSRRRIDGKPSGTGLGLAISRRLARMLSGDVRLESRPGEGATFTFEFPQRIRDPLNDGDKVHASGSTGDDSR
ncbi:MAG: ATP-binding protein, partial [Coriobacteriia bacterium]|nr:ATP-binding protein [Coriobacteriia bacterium]